MRKQLDLEEIMKKYEKIRNHRKSIQNEEFNEQTLKTLLFFEKNGKL